MNELELKRKSIEKWAKVLGFVGLCLILGPLYITILHGISALVALVVAGVIGFVAVNLLPSFATLVGNWRLKALKAVAALNPIETLENQYSEKMEALAAIRENITKSFSVLQNLYSQIQAHNEKFPTRPSLHADKYVKLKALVELRGKKYKQAQANLVKFAELIDEKRSDWDIAKTMAEASELANVGEDFQSKLLQDTAVNTIQSGLNDAFAELETSLLDEQSSTSDTVVEVASVANGKLVSSIPEKCGPPSLDLGFDTDSIEVEMVSPTKKLTPRKSFGKS